MFLFNRDMKHLNTQDYHQNYHTAQVDHILLDVRTAEEFAGGHLPGAINIPLQVLSQRVQDVPQGKPVVVVCATGNRSQSGTNILSRSGYQEVYNLRGGTMAWAMQGLPLE